MGVLDFLKPKPKKELTDLPPPPPPPGKGLDLDLPDIALSPPLSPRPEPSPTSATPPPASPPPFTLPVPITTPSIPPVFAASEPVVLVPPAHEEPPMETQHSLEEQNLPELEEAVVLEPTIQQRMVSQEPIKPMFISVEDYQDILNSITVIKEALRDTEDSMNRLNELKNTQEKILEDWRSHLEDAERKITYVDQVIFRGE